MDPRQINVHTQDYLQSIGQGAKGLKIAVVKEGFGREDSEKVVDETVQKAAKQQFSFWHFEA